MHTKLLSFDGTESVLCNVEKPAKYGELFSLLAKGSFVPRGAGLSYCLASGGDKTTSIESEYFNRIIHFDKEKGAITVEAGMNLGDLLKAVIKEGWFFPVLPGYPKITIGGSIGFNVHGKSQYHIGLFGDYVNSIKLFHPAFNEIDCSRTQNNHIFEMTLGGFGLTGFITEVELKLVPLKNKYVKVKKIPVENFTEAVEFMIRHKDYYETMYSWNNVNNKGSSFGRGFVYVENYLDSGHSVPEQIVQYGNLTWENRTGLKVNFSNNITAPLECKIYELKERLGRKEIILPIEEASFPISGKEIYYKLFGNKGLREYQTIVPVDNWGRFEKELFELIQASGVKFTLGSLKLFNGETSLLNFQNSGVCLALDVPADNRCCEFFNKLDSLVIKHEGIANISKDSRLGPDALKQMYTGYNEFKNNIKDIEKDKPAGSSLRCRINL